MKYAFLLIFSIFASLAYADETQNLIHELSPGVEVTPEQLNLLREEMKVHSMLIEGIEKINIVNGQFENINRATNSVQELLIKGVEEKSRKLPIEIRNLVVNYIQRTSNRENIKRALKVLQEFSSVDIDSTAIKSISEKAYRIALKNKVGTAVRGRMIWAVSLARKFGISAAVFYLVAMQVDYTFPLALIAVGRPELGIPLFAVPFSSTSTSAFIALKNAVKFKKVLNVLGGAGVLLDDFKLSQKLRLFFKRRFFGRTDLIDINFRGRHLVFSVENQRLFARVITSLGWNHNLNYSNLLNFLKEENFEAHAIYLIENSPHPQEVKVLQLLKQIEGAGDESIISKLKSRFHSMINEIEYLPNLSEERAWVLRAASSQSLSELFSHMQRIPDGLPPKVLDQLWREYILAQASQNITPFISKKTYSAFRKMYDDYDGPIRRELFNSTAYSMNPELKTKFGNYLFNALSGVGVCEILYQRPL